MQSTLPFGGKVVLIGGDFRQIPPVLQYIDREAVQAHTLAAVPWWVDGQVHRFTLFQNMRAAEEFWPLEILCSKVSSLEFGKAVLAPHLKHAFLPSVRSHSSELGTNVS